MPERFEPRRLEGTPYRLDSVLGEGAMGEVYLGEHIDLRRPAVIKLIKTKYADEGQVVGRMRREARIVARIRHDALVTIYDLGVAADGRTYIAMEWLEGEVLRRILQTRGPLPIEEACRLVAQACDGLEVAHQQGVIHRDVKPENLFVTSTGQLKVLDFGVAKPMDDGDVTSARTAAGMVLGTPRYMAPEQATGKALSAATDVYAAGCVLFELLTAYPTFDGTDARELLWHHLHSAPPTLQSKALTPFPAELEAIVARALAKDPAQRFVRAGDMATALREFSRRAAAPSIPARVPSVPPPAASDTIRDDVHNKPTIKIDPNATATSAAEDTRAIPAGALVVGVSTTERSPALTASRPDIVIGSATDPVGTTDHAMAATRTAPTEVLVDDRAPAASVSTAPIERKRTPLWPIAAAIALLGFVLFGVVFVLKAGKSEVAAKNEPAAAASAKAPEPAPTPSETVAMAVPAPTPSAQPIAVVSAPTPEPEKPKGKLAMAAPTKPSVAAPTPSASAPATVSAYEHARQLMNDGDLDAAEREARVAIGTHGNAARLLLGEILERKGKPGLARDVYKKILDADPNNATAKTRLAKLGG
ncbi:MAG: protein kinase domain-containing protein [Polyangiales bacterium]